MRTSYRILPKGVTTFKTPLCLLLLLFFLTCCSSPNPTPQTSRLRISFNAMPQTVDPRKAADFISSTLICMIFEGLTRCLSDGNVELALAERVEISSDQTTYTFHLRPSLWSDGRPVKAKDFERSWKNILDPSSPSPSAYLFYPIKNAKRAYEGQVSLEEIGIHSLDDATLEVVLEEPTRYFLSLTAFPSYLPIPENARFEEWTKKGSPLISNGHFVLDFVQPKSHLLLKKNSLFWNPDRVRLDEIHISIVDNETTAFQMFVKGELDWLGGAISPLPVDSLETIRNSYPLSFHPMAATTFCAFKTDHPLLKNSHFRTALSLAINRMEIIDNITQMGENPATRCIPPALLGNRNKILYQAFDPELARLHFKKALEELGLRADQLGTLTLSFRASQVDQRIAQMLQTYWKELLDVDISLKSCEVHYFKELLHRKEFDIALSFWIAQYSDPISILERFEDPKNLKNYPGWDDQTYRTLIQNIRNELDPLERYLLIDAAEELLAKEAPLAPIYHWSNPSLCNPLVQNIETTPNGAVLFERCWIHGS